ncbi:glycosyltransferase family 4 protein [Paenibacillus solisilvae]|uniref:Glycosyltransferase family 4 protein n=1 Tax=Paenibacillus solisilvae TaxID=2486751 RepID=A0ABW0W5Q5_9BACL
MKSYQVCWDGPVYRTSGIGIASREYALALHRKGVNVKIMTARGARFNSTLRRLALKPLARDRKKVLVFHGTPNSLPMIKARKQFKYILLNTVWETTKIPKQWFPQINRFDAVCVPSVQNKRAMKRSGVKKPVFIVPHGVNTLAYTPSNKKLYLGLPKGTFVFVSVFTFQHRKNPETLLKAYWQEFTSRDKVALVIKTSGFGKDTGAVIKARIQAYKKKLGYGRNAAPVRIITGTTGSRMIKGMYTAANAFVLPSRGEGVGLPYLESLSSGVPVIATRWGGHMDFLNARNSFLVGYRLAPPARSMNRSISFNFRSLFAQQGQLWAEPSLASLKKQMRFAYEHPALCRAKGIQGRRDMRRWTWSRAASSMRVAIENTLRTKRG